MGTMNRKVLTRDSSVHLDDADLEHINNEISYNKRTRTLGDGLYQKDGASNIPDIVSSTSETSQSQESMDDFRDPDIVRSNSSSDEKSLEIQISNNRAICRPKVLEAERSSVSTFSSTDCSKKNSSSSHESNIKVQKSTVGLPYNDLQQNKPSVARESSSAHSFYNQDSVFTRESESVSDGSVHYTPWHRVLSSKEILPPVIQTDVLMTSQVPDSDIISRCSEKGQEARHRFSSSGYGTGSGDSSQGTSASKTSVHFSQESSKTSVHFSQESSKTSVHFSQESSNGDTLLQRGVESTSVGRDEPKSAQLSKAALPNTLISNIGAGLHIKNLTKSDSFKPAFQDANSDTRVTAVVSESSKKVITTHGLRHSSCIDGPGVSLEPQTPELRQQNQQAHKNILLKTNPLQVERQSFVGLQNVRQSQLNPTPQNLRSSQADAVPPDVKHIQANTLPQNIEQFWVNTLPQNIEQFWANTRPQNIEQFWVNTLPQNREQFQANILPQNTGQSQANILPQNTGRSQKSLDPQRLSQVNNNNGLSQTPQLGPVGTAPMSLRQQATLASNGKLNTSYEYHHQMKLLSIQHHPPSSGSLNYTTTPMSSSSSGSCFVPPSVEDRWAAEHSPASLAKICLQSGSGASESSGESRYHLESLLRTENLLIQRHAHTFGGGNFPAFHQLLPQSSHLSESSNPSVLAEMFSNRSLANGELPEKTLWEKLQMSARCNETTCSIPECAQIKAVIADLENESHDVQSLDGSLKNLLLAMFNHMAYACDHPKCPFVWCGERIDNSHDLTPDECLLIMKQRMENFAEHCRLFKNPLKYMKLKTSFPYNCMPEEDQHWMRLCMMGTSRKTLLVKPLQFHRSDPFCDSGYWVIKKAYLTDEGDNWSVYSKLREVKHRSVVSLLWAASFEDHMLVCSVYEGFSLNDYLPCLSSSQSRFIPVFCIMQQLISAVRHVNSLGIVYLNWTSKNILVTYHLETYFLVKLSNFSCSVLLEHPDGKRPCYDGGYLSLALPWHVVTPELKNNFKVEYVSDVWGIGCLLHELATGYPIWHPYRHEDFVKSLVGTQPPVPNTSPELSEMFTACWQLDPSRRVQMSDLEIMLIQAFSHHLGS